MTAIVKLDAYYALPCALRSFTINGVDAADSDFGGGWDHDAESAEEYGCGCWRFEAEREDEDHIARVMSKYGISKEDYLEICDALEAALNVGRCGWCV